MGDNDILTFHPTVLDKKMALSCLILFVKPKKLHVGQLFPFVFIKFRNSDNFFYWSESFVIRPETTHFTVFSGAIQFY